MGKLGSNKKVRAWGRGSFGGLGQGQDGDEAMWCGSSCSDKGL